jgi:hypothetical protein
MMEGQSSLGLEKACLSVEELYNQFKAERSEISEQIELFYNIAMCLFAGSSIKDRFKNFLEDKRIRKEPYKIPVIILAGGASLMDETMKETYRECFRKFLRGFNGTIISGGTTAGVPGLAGEVKHEMQKQSSVDFDLIAYLPGKLPPHAIRSAAYDHFYETDSDDFSVLDILSYWCDLVGGGIPPAEVVLVGIDGGSIASMEYRIALSLGAKVSIVAHSGRAADDFLQDKSWNNHPNLMQITGGPITVGRLRRLFH